jgi:ABC-type branched-subunit amino acid transport system substrate-binding protein
MRRWAHGLSACVLLLALGPAAAGTYDQGATDTEIRIGHTAPYSGPVSAIGQGLAGAQVAYWHKVNEEGGVNGRKVDLISLDDAYSPPKTVEQTRRLVEQDGVLATIGSVGTAPQFAVTKYLNARKIPQLLLATGIAWTKKPKQFPWTTGFYPSYELEGATYGRHILQTRPAAKVAVFYQNDDFGKEFLRGVRIGLGDRADMIVSTAAYEVADPTVDSQIVALAASGADVLVNISTPKFAAQAIRKAYEINWRPTRYLVSTTTSVAAVLEPAGLERSVGLLTAAAFKIPGDPAWDDDEGMKAYLAFVRKWMPNQSPYDFYVFTGYSTALLADIILRKAGDDLTRENLLKQATSMVDVPLPVLLPGVTLTYTSDDYSGFTKLRMSRFDGKRWVLFSDAIDVGRLPQE